MKILPEHYTILKNAIIPLHTPERMQAYKIAGLSNKRYRWDLLYNAKLSSFICDTLYKYCDDSHIDTALRNIISNK